MWHLGENIICFTNSISSYMYSVANFSLFTLKRFVIFMQNKIRIVFGISNNFNWYLVSIIQHDSIACGNSSFSDSGAICSSSYQ